MDGFSFSMACSQPRRTSPPHLFFIKLFVPNTNENTALYFVPPHKVLRVCFVSIASDCDMSRCLQSVLCLCGQCLFAFLFVSFILFISCYIVSHIERSVCLSCVGYNSDNMYLDSDIRVLSVSKRNVMEQRAPEHCRTTVYKVCFKRILTRTIFKHWHSQKRKGKKIQAVGVESSKYIWN